jgi:DNA replication ATP-dependent helicase Dna2
MFAQRDFVYALEEELRISSKPLKYKVKETRAEGSGLFRVFIDPFAYGARGLDESLEGAAAWWPGPPKGTADVLSVSAEHDQINIRYLTAPPPAQGSDISVYPPRYLEKLKEIWESPLAANKCLSWIGHVSSLTFPALPDIEEVPGFPNLRRRQRQAFGLLDREFGFLWGPPGTGKTYTLGAMLAHYLRRYPAGRILLLSTTNSAVDLALVSVDQHLEEVARADRSAALLRKQIKRIGHHFIAANYKGREHLLPATDPDLVTQIAALEALMPEKSDASKYAAWKDKIEALRKQIPKPLREARLAAMTTTAATFHFSALQQLAPYSLVVFDESSQVSLPHASALAGLGKKTLFAGDHQQLAPIVQSDHPDAKKYLSVSMFDYMTVHNRCLLNEQSRMTEEICDIVSHVFYEGELMVADGCEDNALWRSERRSPPLPKIGSKRVHLEMCQEEGSFKLTRYGIGTRYKSAEYVSELAASCAAQMGEDSVLVLTPYRAQRALIKTFLKNAGWRGVRVSTVHRAQGTECHTVIFDPVIASGNKLLGDRKEGPRLINVALSRAKARLILVLSAGDLCNEYLRRIAHVIDGTGKFDEAVPMSELIAHPNFPENAIGTVVRWGNVVGRIESCGKQGFFHLNDFVTGQKKSFSTAVVRGMCSQTTTAAL